MHMGECCAGPIAVSMGDLEAFGMLGRHLADIGSVNTGVIKGLSARKPHIYELEVNIFIDVTMHMYSIHLELVLLNDN